jgi:hypothetical protein
LNFTNGQVDVFLQLSKQRLILPGTDEEKIRVDYFFLGRLKFDFTLGL